MGRSGMGVGAGHGFETHVLKVPFDQIELLRHAHAGDLVGTAAQADTVGPPGLTFTKLNDAVSSAIGGFGVETVALHQSHSSEIIG